MKATVHIFLKAGVLDVQGKAVEGALNGLSAASGWSDVANVRVGKVLEFDVKSTDKAAAEAEVKTMCSGTGQYRDRILPHRGRVR